MKRISLFLAAVLLSTSMFAGNPGGKVIVQKYTGSDAAGAEITVSWYLQNNAMKMKMDYTAQKTNTSTFFLPDLAAMKLLTYTVDASATQAPKVYYSIPVEKIKPAAGQSSGLLNVKRTGEKKTLGGMNCEKVIVKNGNTTTEMWVTTDFTPDYYAFYPFFRNSAELAALNQEQIAGFPLVSVTRDISGKVVGGYELISVTPAEMGPADFSVPADYQSAESLTKAKK